MSERWMRDGRVRMNPMDETGAAEAVDRRVARALGRMPLVNIPEGFAARVAGQVPASGPVSVAPARYGLIAMRGGMAVLLLALAAMATSSTGWTAIGVTVEWMLCAQLVALAIWLGGVRVFSAPDA